MNREHLAMTLFADEIAPTPRTWKAIEREWTKYHTSVRTRFRRKADRVLKHLGRSPKESDAAK